MGFTTMNRDRGMGVHVYDKLSGADPNTYQVINVISHGGSYAGYPCEIVTRPRDSDGEMSCVYSLHYFNGSSAHYHSVNGHRPASSVGRARLQRLSGVPSVHWIMFQSCYSAKSSLAASLMSQAYSEGVDTSTGFYGKIYIGGSSPSNGKTIHYNFSAMYWKQLYLGRTNAQALDSAADRVLAYHGSYKGYDDWRSYGSGRRLN
jgi:hypothetical protein